MSEVICLNYVNSYAVLEMCKEYKNSMGVVFLYQASNYLNITVYIKNIGEDMAHIPITASIGKRLNLPIYYDNGKIKTSITSKDYNALDFVGDDVKIFIDDKIIASGVIVKDIRKYDYHYKII